MNMQTKQIEKEDASRQSLSNGGLAGPFHVLLVDKNCPSCNAPPADHHIENYDMMWQDGDVVCKCGAYVRGYDAS